MRSCTSQRHRKQTPMPQKFTADRRNQLAQIVLSEGRVTVADAAERFGVSRETIRKDLLALEREGLVSKSYGGAMAKKPLVERPMLDKQTENSRAKRAVALRAAQMIPDGSSVLLDAGSTTLALAEVLAERSGLTIFTHSIGNLHALELSDNNVFVFGGMLDKRSMLFMGSWTNDQLSTIKTDFSFLGTDGFLGFGGPTTSSYPEAEIKPRFLTAAARNVVLADSSKFRSSGFFQFATWGQIDAFVTDSGVSDADAQAIGQRVELIVAGDGK